MVQLLISNFDFIAQISEPNKFKGFHPFAETDLDIFAHMHNELNMILKDQLNFTLAQLN